MSKKSIFCHYRLIIFLISIVIIVLVACCGALQRTPASTVSNTAAIEGWPWFEDYYFNLRFQYPPEWRVEKVDVTNYYDDSESDLMGEDSAVAGPDRFKTWEL